MHVLPKAFNNMIPRSIYGGKAILEQKISKLCIHWTVNEKLS
jgi:hypothetical protein